MEKFALGVIVGSIGGALLVANNYKMRTLVKKSQEEVQNKINELLDEKIKEMDGGFADDFNASGDKLEPETDEPVPAPKKTAKRNVKRAQAPAN